MNTGEQISGPPDHFWLCLSGWPPFGPNNFRWERGLLLYDISNLSMRHDACVRIGLSTEKWDQAWKVCDKLDVWSWPLSFGNQDICDGLKLMLEIRIGSRTLISRGQLSGAGELAKRALHLHKFFQSLTGWPANHVRLQVGRRAIYFDKGFVIPVLISQITDPGFFQMQLTALEGIRFCPQSNPSELPASFTVGAEVTLRHAN